MKYVMYKLVQIKKGQHVFECHKTFKGSKYGAGEESFQNPFL